MQLTLFHSVCTAVLLQESVGMDQCYFLNENENIEMCLVSNFNSWSVIAILAYAQRCRQIGKVAFYHQEQGDQQRTGSHC